MVEDTRPLRRGNSRRGYPQGPGTELNADYLDDQEGTYYLSRTNHTGVQDHNATLSNIQGGSATERYHLTAAQTTGLTGGNATTLHKHTKDFSVTPSSVTLDAGGSTGTSTDMSVFGTTTFYHIDEVAATPGIDAKVLFTGVTSISAVYAKFHYDGTATHGIRTEILNWSTTTYEVLDTHPGDTLDFVTVYVPIPSDTNYISSGQARVRFDHAEAGNPAHNLDIDFVALIK